MFSRLLGIPAKTALFCLRSSMSTVEHEHALPAVQHSLVCSVVACTSLSQTMPQTPLL